MANGGTAKDVEIVSDLFGRGYSWILTSDDEQVVMAREELLGKLEQAIIRKDRNILFRFLIASSFGEQLEILGIRSIQKPLSEAS